MTSVSSAAPQRLAIGRGDLAVNKLKLIPMPDEVKAGLAAFDKERALGDAMMRDPAVSARHDAVRAHTVFRDSSGRILGVLWQDGQDADWSGRGAHGLDKSGAETTTPGGLDRFAATLRQHYGPGVVAERVMGRADAPTRGEVYGGWGAGAGRIDLARGRGLDLRV